MVTMAGMTRSLGCSFRGLQIPFSCSFLGLQRYFCNTSTFSQRKVAIVTGSSSGIGQGIAIELSRRGYALTLCGRNQVGLDTTKNICLQNGLQESEILQVRGDISEPEEPNRIASLTTANFGQINALVNNAGGGLAPDTLEAVTSESFDSLFSLNLRAPILLSKACMPQLVKNNGVIVNISSAVCHMPSFGLLLYRLTKVALDAFTTSIACDYGSKGVRVCGILPGHVHTGIQEKIFKDIADPADAKKSLTAGILAAQSIKREGTVKDMSDTVAFLLSDEASFITGVNLVVDGGLQFQAKGDGGFVQPSD